MQISDIILQVNLIGTKMSVASFSGAGVRRPQCSRGFRGQSTLRKFLGSNEHLDWFKIDFNAAKVITVQGTKKNKQKQKCGMEVHIYSV